MHPNDTLNGALLAHERPEDRHLRHSFGYWTMVERRVIRERLIAEGMDANDPGLTFAVSAQVERNHARDETHAEATDRRARERDERVHREWGAGESTASVGLTKPELEFLAEHFEGANDPLAADILAKSLAVLARR